MIMSHRWQSASHDLERLLELDHEFPVVLLEVVAEVVLAGVDRGAVDLAHQKVLKQNNVGQVSGQNLVILSL